MHYRQPVTVQHHPEPFCLANLPAWSQARLKNNEETSTRDHRGQFQGLSLGTYLPFLS